MKVMEIIEKTGILPVINITDLEVAKPLAQAFCDEGIPVIEVTLRNEKSLEAVKLIRSEFPEMGILAGTVLSVEQAQNAISAGVDGIVMPGYDDEIVDFALENNIPIVPGCVTAADIQKGYKKGLRVFKFFPAEQCGGIPALKLLSGPFKGVKFLPTGGINYDNLGEYLKNDFIIACGGSYMADAKTLGDKNFDKIRENCRKAMSISLDFKLAHIGVNSDDKGEADKTAKLIASVFGLGVRECSGSTFAGNAVECMHNRRFGEKGHIGFSTNSMIRAMAYLADKGIEFDESSIKRDASGKISCIYLKENIAGFALHIVKN